MTKSYTLYIILALIIGLSIGRYTAPVKTKVVEHTVTVEVEKKTSNTKQDTTIVETKKPDGTVTKVTTITETQKVDTNISVKTDDNKTTSNTYSSNKSLNVYALAEFNGLSSITYGAHISKNLIGPLSVGAFGFTDGKFGVSVGLSF